MSAAAPIDPRAGWLGRLLEASLAHPWRAVVVSLLATTLCGSGAAWLRVETSTDSVLSREHASWHFYRESTERFGGDEVVVAALRGPVPFDPGTLREVARVTERLEASPLFRRVDSIASVPVVRGTPDGALSLDPALSGPPDDIDPAAVRAALAGDRIAPRLLVSDDGTTFSVTGLMEELGAERDAQAVAAMRSALGATPAPISGGPVFRAAMNRLLIDDLALFIPISALFIAGLCIASFGTWAAAFVPLATGGLANGIVLGLMGFAGVPLTVSTVILPTILLALACAYVMHLLWAAAGPGGHVPDAAEALAERLAPVARPIALSGLTTALGFLAMSLVRIDVIRDVGVFGAIGALVLVALSLGFAPALLRLTARQGGARDPVLRRAADRFAARAAHLPRGPILIGWLAATAALAIGVVRLEIETDVILWFPEGTAIRDDYAAIRSALSGISPMNVVIEADADALPTEAGPDDPRITHPPVMQAIAALSAHLEALPAVGRSLAITDPLLQLHRGFLGDPQAPLPETQPAHEQYLLLLDSVEALRDLVTPDRRAASVALRVDDNGSDALLAVAAEAEDWWAANGAPGYRARTTGIMHEYARSEDEIQAGQLRGLAFAIGAVALVLLAVFRSARVAALALIPNIVPLVAAFGAMGLAGIALDAGTVLLGSLALGIAVDDTIHLLSAVEEGRAAGLDGDSAVRDGMRRVLPPVLLSTVAIGVGFGILGLSSFVLTRNLGLVTAVIMFVCFAADATLLPALLRPRAAKPDGTRAAA